ncbi:MAG: DUF3179 domain-containing protein [Candidatus Thiodiazotropha sp. (ex Lucinoma borealis)]|nr:DUF3179 domain-containing protein [Candidatus Thiodiazotropha sp. (ex Lucinoma borealis)]
MTTSIEYVRFVIAVLIGGLLFGQLEARTFKGGFDVTDAQVPIKNILPGGPPKDGIPSIDKPRFVTANKAKFLDPEDRVLGLAYNGQVKAYPISILNWHEIVNDRFGNERVTVTFCPLCGTGIAFKAKLDNKPLLFGVSGLLYNSDMLLYDRTTESLWSQIKREAISGKYKGRRLTPISLQHTTWSDWQQQYPATKVLSQDTGFSRNYQRSPYQGYETSRSIYFPVEFASKGYHPKERVLGLEIEGVSKAYPFAELSKTTGLIKENVAGKEVVIHYDIDNQSASVSDSNGNTIHSVIAFWFAWYTFYPDTELFQVE